MSKLSKLCPIKEPQVGLISTNWLDFTQFKGFAHFSDVLTIKSGGCCNYSQ